MGPAPAIENWILFFLTKFPYCLQKSIIKSVLLTGVNLKALPILKTISCEEKIKLTLELFFIADAYRFIKFYLDGKHNIDNEKFKLLSNAKGIHYLFQKELENY